VITVNGYTQSQDFSGAALVIDQLGEPDRSFQVLAGDATGDLKDKTYFDMALAKQLLAGL